MGDSHRKVAVVTGAGKGMGRSIARTLADSVSTVIVNDLDGDEICEPEDGDVCEAFTDGYNGIYDEGEPFEDENEIFWWNRELYPFLKLFSKEN